MWIALILGGDFYTGSVLASTLTKLVLRYSDLEGVDAKKANSLRAEVRPAFSSTNFQLKYDPVGDADHDLSHPSRSIPIRGRPDRRRQSRTYPELRADLGLGRTCQGYEGQGHVLEGYQGGVCQDGCARGGKFSRDPSGMEADSF